MGARKHETDQSRFISRQDVEPLKPDVNISDLLALAPVIIHKSTRNAIVQRQGIDWGEYKPKIENGVGYIVRETCERCGTKVLPPGQRKLRCVQTDLGPVYLDTGICRDCINASIYVDKYLDGDPLSEQEAKQLFYKYAEEYEKQWRITLAMAPRIAMTKAEWEHRCKFFGGCALCGGYIEVQHKYFPSSLNGSYSPWNIIPLCGACEASLRTLGKRKSPEKAPKRYKVFSSSSMFQKTKTIRLFLLAQMEMYNVYIDNLAPYRQRFFEKKILPHSLPVELNNQDLEAACIQYGRSHADKTSDVLIRVKGLQDLFSDEELITALDNNTFEALCLMEKAIRFSKGDDNLG